MMVFLTFSIGIKLVLVYIVNNFMKYLVLLLFLYSSSLYSQEITPAVKQLRVDLNRYNNLNQLDSIGYLIECHLAKNDLSVFELQLGLFFQGNYYNKIERASDAIIALRNSIALKGEGKEYTTKVYLSWQIYILLKKNIKKYFIMPVYAKTNFW